MTAGERDLYETCGLIMAPTLTPAHEPVIAYLAIRRSLIGGWGPEDGVGIACRLDASRQERDRVAAWAARARR